MVQNQPKKHSNGSGITRSPGLVFKDFTQPQHCLKAARGFAQVYYKYLRKTSVGGGVGLHKPERGE